MTSNVTASRTLSGMMMTTRATQVFFVYYFKRSCVMYTMLYTSFCIPITDGCQRHPCDHIDHAMAGQCRSMGASGFECACKTSFTWDRSRNACIYGGYCVRRFFHRFLLRLNTLYCSEFVFDESMILYRSVSTTAMRCYCGRLTEQL